VIRRRMRSGVRALDDAVEEFGDVHVLIRTSPRCSVTSRTRRPCRCWRGPRAGAQRRGGTPGDVGFAPRCRAAAAPNDPATTGPTPPSRLTVRFGRLTPQRRSQAGRCRWMVSTRPSRSMTPRAGRWPERFQRIADQQPVVQPQPAAAPESRRPGTPAVEHEVPGRLGRCVHRGPDSPFEEVHVCEARAVENRRRPRPGSPQHRDRC
jgi:hypothetical protein